MYVHVFQSWLLSSVPSIPNLEVFHMCFLPCLLFMLCLSVSFRFPVLSFTLSSAALMCRNRSGNASTSTLHGSIQNLSQFEQVYWADGAYLTLSYNTLLSVWLFMTCACCLARVWHHISKIARTSAFVVAVVVSSLFLCVFVFCLHSPFACVCLSRSLSYGNSIPLWVHSWAQCECGDGWSCPAGNQDVNRSLDCFRHVQGGGHIRCNNSAVASL